MTDVVYEGLLAQQMSPAGYFLSDEAKAYIYEHLDMGYEDAVRHVLRYTVVPAWESTGAVEREHTKAVLQWFLNCASDDQCDDVIAGDPEWVMGSTEPPRLFYLWWWKELFGDEEWRSTDICKAQLSRGNVPREILDNEWPTPTDPAVLEFPRRDGMPPGHDPPARLYRAPAQPPLRPRDASRFLRYQDQAEAIERARDVHSQSGQHKVWVEFQHIIGEGYLIGGQEYRETNWACVRFRNGQPVDSWPDLRKGWTPE